MYLLGVSYTLVRCDRADGVLGVADSFLASGVDVNMRERCAEGAFGRAGWLVAATMVAVSRRRRQ